MSEVVDANGCIMINDTDISVIVVKKNGNCSMREALYKAISLLKQET
jgi:hypothetical protein